MNDKTKEYIKGNGFLLEVDENIKRLNHRLSKQQMNSHRSIIELKQELQAQQYETDRKIKKTGNFLLEILKPLIVNIITLSIAIFYDFHVDIIAFFSAVGTIIYVVSRWLEDDF